MFPVVMEEVPKSLYCLKVFLITCSPIQIHIGFDGSHKIIMWTVIRILPDGISIAFGKPFHPIVLLEVALHDHNLLGLTHRREVSTSQRYGSLNTLSWSEKHLGQIRRLLKPVIESAEQGESLRVAGISCLDESMADPGPYIGSVLEIKDGSLGISHEIPIRFLAKVDDINDAVEACLQRSIIHPSESPTGTHQEASCAGAWQLCGPEITVPSTARRKGHMYTFY